MSNNTRTARQAWAGAKSFHLWTSETGCCECGVFRFFARTSLRSHHGDKSFAPEPEQKRMPTRSFETAGNHARQTTKPARAVKRRIMMCRIMMCRIIPPVWWSQTGSNRRPPACKAGALPTELWPLQVSGISNQRSRKPELLIPDI